MNANELRSLVESINVGEVLEVRGNLIFESTFIRLSDTTFSWIKDNKLCDDSINTNTGKYAEFSIDEYAEFSIDETCKRLRYAVDAGCSINHPDRTYEVSLLINNCIQS